MFIIIYIIGIVDMMGVCIIVIVGVMDREVIDEELVLVVLGNFIIFIILLLFVVFLIGVFS